MPKCFYSDRRIRLYHGDALDISRQLGDGLAGCIVTSPPYFGLRDYGIDGQYGLEKSPAEYVETMRALFHELRRVLADDGTLWLNIGDSYASGPIGKQNGQCGNGATDGGVRVRGLKVLSTHRPVSDVPPKNLLGVPWRTAFALQDDGWILRNAIVWEKPNAMPESVTDRFSGRYEHVFLFSKQQKYWFDLDPLREKRTRGDEGAASAKDYNRKNPFSTKVTPHRNNPESVFNSGVYKTSGKNPGDVWCIPTTPFAAAHFAVYPVELAQRAILAGCRPGGTVLDPFTGSGTTGRAALNTKRRFIGIDLNADYLKMSLTHPHRFGKAPQ